MFQKKRKLPVLSLIFVLIVLLITFVSAIYFYRFFNKRMNRLAVGIIAKDMLVDEDRTTRAVFLEKFVDDAARYIETKDLTDRVVQEEMSGGLWRVWDYYLFIYTMEDFVCLGHGANLARLGKSYENETNFIGDAVIARIIRAVEDPSRNSSWISYYWKNIADVVPKLKYVFLKHVKDVKGLDVVVGAGFYSSMPFPFVETFYQLGKLLDSYKKKISVERFKLLRETVDILNTTKNIFLTTYSNKSVSKFFSTILHSNFVRANIKIAYYDGEETIASVGRAKNTSKIFELNLKPQFRFSDELMASKQKERKISIFMDSEKRIKDIKA